MVNWLKGLKRLHLRLTKSAWRTAGYVVAGFLMAFIAVWISVLIPILSNKDPGLQANLITSVSIYDARLGSFGSAVTLPSIITYKTSANGNLYDVNAELVTDGDSTISKWQSNYAYQVNSRTNEIQGRDGFLYGRAASSSTEDYVFWHPKYDFALNMSFAASETVQGIKTNCFQATYDQNVTQQLRDSEGYTGANDVVSKGAVTVWIEPVTGNLINFKNSEELYYYDPQTGAELAPWKKIASNFESSSVASLSAKTQSQITILTVVNTWVLAILTLILIAILSFIVGDFFAGHKNLRIERISASMFSVVILLCPIIIVGGLLVDLNQVMLVNNVLVTKPAAAILLLILTVLAVFLAYANGLSRFVKTILLLTLAVFWAGGIFYLSGGGDIETTGADSICFTLLCLALGLAIINSTKKAPIIIFRILIASVAILGLCSELSVPFRSELSNFVPWLINMPMPTALLFILLSVAIFRSCYKNAKNPLNLMSMPTRAAVVVTCLVILLTGFIWSTSRNITNQNTQRAFEDDTNEITNLIDKGFNSQIIALESGAGLFNASEDVTRLEWNEFFSSLHPLENLSGVEGVGFGRVATTQEQLGQIEQGLRDANYEYTTIYPQEPTRDTYVIVDYVEPYEQNKTAFGYDMYSNAQRREAMDAARDTGEVTMSSKIFLIIDPSNPQPSFQMYAPVYKKGTEFDTLEQRREGIIGYVFSLVRIADFMKYSLGDQYSDIGIAIYDSSNLDDTTEVNFMYSSTGSSNFDDSKYSSSIIYTAANHSWVIKYGSLPSYGSSSVTNYSLYVLISGFVLSFVVGVTTYGLYGSRQRAMRLATSITSSLRSERNQAVRLKKEDEAILLSMGQGMLFFDNQSIIRQSNSRLFDITGYSKSEYLGHKLSEVLKIVEENDGVRPASDLVIQGVSKARKSANFERIIMCKDGSTVPVVVDLSPVFVGSRSIGVVAIITDMSKQRQFDEAKNMFLMLATHQIKTPATAIKWYSEMLLEKEDLSANNKKLAMLIDSSVKHMMYIMDNLLDVSSIETGQLKLNLKHADLEQIIKQVIDDFKIQIASKKQIVKFSCVDNLSLVATDKQLITQVFANLINNAIKYSPDGSEVDVNITQDLNDVIVTVKDRGMGIPKAQHAEVFKKFFRAQNAARQESSGNGLGLFLVKAVVEASDGKVSFVSEEDKGSTFTVTLPRHTEEKQVGLKINK